MTFCQFKGLEEVRTACCYFFIGRGGSWDIPWKGSQTEQSITTCFTELRSVLCIDSWRPSTGKQLCLVIPKVSERSYTNRSGHIHIQLYWIKMTLNTVQKLHCTHIQSVENDAHTYIHFTSVPTNQFTHSCYLSHPSEDPIAQPSELLSKQRQVKEIDRVRPPGILGRIYLPD